MKNIISRTVNYISILTIAWLLTNCAATNYRQGLRQLKQDNYYEAINLLEAAELEKPNDARVKRDLGVAYYKAKRLNEAINKLNKAKFMNPKDSKTIFYLGLTYEEKGMLDKAIDEYKNYRNQSRSRGFRNEISKRIKQLTNDKVSNEIARALAEEQKLDVAAIPQNTVAVLYFRNLGTDRALDPLQKGIAVMLMTDLSKVNKLQVIERLKLQKLLEELKLGTTGLVDDQTAPRVGKLLGARKLINGGFLDLSGANLRIDAAMAEAATAEILEIQEVTGRLMDIFRLEKKLAFQVIDEMGIILTKEEREAIQKIPTESLLAFMAYSKGLDYEDRGLYSQAIAEFQRALSLDPNFELAKQSLEDVEISQRAATEGKTDITSLESEFQSKEFASESNVSVARLFRTGEAAQTGQAPQGDNDTREPLQEDTGTDRLRGSAATILIRIPLPD